MKAGSCFCSSLKVLAGPEAGLTHLRQQAVDLLQGLLHRCSALAAVVQGSSSSSSSLHKHLPQTLLSTTCRNRDSMFTCTLWSSSLLAASSSASRSPAALSTLTFRSSLSSLSLVPSASRRF